MPDLILDLFGKRWILLKETRRIGLALTNFLTLVGIPGARLVDQIEFDSPIDHLAHLIDANAIHNLKLRLLKGRRNFIFDHFYSGLIAHDLITVFHRTDSANIKAH